MGLTGEPVLAASTDSQTKAYETLDPDAARARRIADAVAACAARQIKADLYVTDREYLHRLTRSIGEGVTFCTAIEALALVGLYLRSQGDFLIWKDSGNDTPYRFDKSLYYWVGAGELLPAGWRWFTACVMHEQTQASGPVPLENTMRPGDLRVLGDQAAWVYSLIRPLRTGLRRICCLSTSVTIARTELPILGVISAR
jgi:hypothetical protein